MFLIFFLKGEKEIGLYGKQIFQEGNQKHQIGNRIYKWEDVILVIMLYAAINFQVFDRDFS